MISKDQQIMSKAQAPHTEQKYVITFLVNNKKISFEVSELSYNGYKLNQKGILTYKGTRIIDFCS